MKHLILLHGALGHPAYFDFIKEALAEEYLVHTPAFTGHADPDWKSSELSTAAYIDQLKDYCAAHGLEQVLIFGYSMGGYVALCYAAQYPEKVAAVMTLATKLNWSPEIAAQEVKMLESATIKEKVPKFAAYLASVHGEDNWEQLCRGIASLLTGLGNEPFLGEDALAAIQSKALLMVGDKDNMVGIEETLAAARRINNAGFAVLPDTGHPFERINRALLLQLIRDFFKA